MSLASVIQTSGLGPLTAQPNETYTLLSSTCLSGVITRVHIDVIVQTNSSSNQFSLYLTVNGAPLDAMLIAVNDTQYTYTFDLGNTVAVYATPTPGVSFDFEIQLETGSSTPANTLITYTCEIQAYQ